MKMSNSFFYTRREFPKDECTISSKLLIKSGFIYKNSSGIYSYTPIGYKTIRNIENIIRGELNKNRSYEVFLPSLINNDGFEFTLKEKIFDKEIYSLKDRNNKAFTLCPSSEEIFIDLAKQKIQSYKDLHFSLYQMSNKFRDEMHPEYGLIRKKEFNIMEGYSFDVDEGGLEVSYDKMFLAFKNIFMKVGLDTLIVESDEIDCLESEEFQVLSEYGDNKIAKCSVCTYASILEDASSNLIYSRRDIAPKKKELIDTPNVRTIKELSNYLNVFPNSILKSIICKVDGKYKMILLKGNSELNVKKLMKLFKTSRIEVPSASELEKMGTAIGYIGPVNSTMEIIADNEVKNMYNFICGGNKKNYHYKNVNYGRDFKIQMFADLKLFDKESLCPKCKNKCDILKGIEVGQIFKYGKYYSEIFNLSFTNEVNKKEYVSMGSYRIGIDRILASIVENNYDEKGIIWPMKVAPYKVAIIVYNVNDHDLTKYAFNLYEKLLNLGIETIIDDRKESIGVKFNDMDLIGVPIRITVGKTFNDGVVELKLRKENRTRIIKINRLIEAVQSIIEMNNVDIY